MEERTKEYLIFALGKYESFETNLKELISSVGGEFRRINSSTFAVYAIKTTVSVKEMKSNLNEGDKGYFFFIFDITDGKDRYDYVIPIKKFEDKLFEVFSDKPFMERLMENENKDDSVKLKDVDEGIEQENLDLDSILDKINEKGFDALTEREKEYLEQVN